MKHKIMRRLWPALLCPALLTACAGGSGETPETGAPAADETSIVLSDSGVEVDGQAAPASPDAAVYVGADIVYYEDGQDASYGEGTGEDAHTDEEAAAHTVVTITQPGTYRVSGALSLGQLAVDLGEDAEKDPEAVVTLILDGADITCTVAPAVIFYNVYECGSSDEEGASPAVDTSAAGANVVLSDGSVNNITGSYVARIYKEGTTDKLHKYDGAFYSKMSMNLDGETAGTGILNLTADNEGLGSELHLTINGGVINITADNDGINTNEDGVSVTTVNGGTVTITGGLGAEGDGIDSNGYLVVNGGTVVTTANPQVGEGGIDSDSGIYLNGGTVIALGSRNDSAAADSAQALMELTFRSTVAEGSAVELRDSEGTAVVSFTAPRDFSSATLSAPELAWDSTYTLWVDGVQQQYTGTGAMAGPGGGGQPPEGMEPGGRPDDSGAADEPGETAFAITADSHAFQGVGDLVSGE